MALPQLPFTAKTNVSWPGEEEGDLGFLENEIIEVLAIVDDSWWNGRLKRNKAEGVFPASYVKVLEDSLSKSANRASFPASPSRYAQEAPPPLYEYEDINNSMRETDRRYYNSESKRNSANLAKPATAKRHSQNSTPTHQPSYEDQEYYKQASAKHESYRQPRSPKRDSYNNSYSPQQYQSTDDIEREIERLRQLKQQQLVLQQSQHQYLQAQQYHSQAKLPKSHSYNDIEYKVQYAPTSHQRQRKEQNNGYVTSPSRPGKMIHSSSEMAISKTSQIHPHYNEEHRYTQKKPKSKDIYSANKRNDYSMDDEYSYDDSSRRYQSQENLSKKLSKYISDSESEDESQPPPPPPHKHSIPLTTPKIPFDADDFRLSSNAPNTAANNEEEILLLQQKQQLEELRNSVKSLQSDVLNLSELSATSAGSFIRHKYDKQVQDQQLKMANLSLASMTAENDRSILESIFQDKKSKHPNIFKKILNKNKSENIVEQKFSRDEESDWMNLKSDLFRLNSLTSRDKQLRTRRVAQENVSLILKPLEFISAINQNETENINIDDEFEFTSNNFKRPDEFMKSYSNDDLNDFIYDISVKFRGSVMDQIRCVMLKLCKFRIIEETDKISQIKPKLNEIIHKNEGSIYQLNYLFKKMLDIMKIRSEIVLGFWKKPNEFYHDDNFIVNHSWLSICIKGQFRFIDLLLFKNYKLCNLTSYNEFYFLAKPLDIISTHLPSIIDLQHVVPPVDQNIAFTLPKLYSGYHKNNLHIINFNNALTKLTGSEFFEIDLEIPINIELFTLVKTGKSTTNELTLCQIYWNNNKRIAKIKALLPDNETVGFLQIFSGKKGLQKYFDNIHELSISIPLEHNGNYKESKPKSKFVTRFPNIQAQNNDLYVKQPQVQRLIARNNYNFQVIQSPAMGITTQLTNSQGFKLAIEAPSGKYYKLTKEDEKPYGLYEANIKCSELGTYRGLVIGDSGNSWYVFSQWECVASL